MKPYPKIENVFERDETTYKLIEGQWRTPELEYLKDSLWFWTEKIDGTNIRVMWDGEKVTFGGRTERAQIPANLYEKLQELFPVEKFEHSGPMCLYGEGYGKKIQKAGSGYIPDGVSFILFDVKIGDWWLQREGVLGVAKGFGINVVPWCGSGTLYEAVDAVKQRPMSAIQGSDIPIEGLVATPVVQLFDRQGNRIITKIKSLDIS